VWPSGNPSMDVAISSFIRSQKVGPDPRTRCIFSQDYN
jgi:hypothetical protein